MADIRTKDIIKGTVKTLEKGIDASHRIKTAYVETKEKAEKATSPEETSPSEYAQQRVTESGEKFARACVQVLNQQGKKGVAETRNNVLKAKQYFEKKQFDKAKTVASNSVHKNANSGSGATPRAESGASKRTVSSPKPPQECAKKLAEKNIRSTYARHKNNTAHAIRQSNKCAGVAADTSSKSIKAASKSAIKSAGKANIKTAGRSVKTAQQTARATVKTAQHTTAAAKHAATTAVKTAQSAAYTAKNAAKATVQAAKTTVKATLAVIKAIIAGAKALFAAIAAAGWVAVVVLLLICFIGLLVASPFGMFFSGDAVGGTSPIQVVVAETSNEFSARVIDIVNTNAHDELRMTFTNRGHGRADNWMDVLAIFAVSTATQDVSGADVVLMDEGKAAKIRDIFWEMADIQHHIETQTHEEPVLDELGEETGETTTITRSILILAITFKGAAETADVKGFTHQQKEIVSEMLSGEYDEMFSGLIGNIGLVSMAGDGSGAVGTGSFIWPVPSTDIVVSPFGSRVDPLTGRFDTHLGIDITGPTGTQIVASDGGTVASTSIDASYGIHALIDHGNGTSTLYAHLNSIAVAAGEAITQGQTIGGMGETGRVTGVHLHFEVWQGGARVDPLGYFSNYTTAW